MCLLHDVFGVSLFTFGMVVGYLTAIFNTVSLTFMLIFVSGWDDDLKNVKFPYMPTTYWGYDWLSIMLMVIILSTASSVLLVIGAKKKVEWMLVPWLFINGLEVILRGVFCLGIFEESIFTGIIELVLIVTHIFLLNAIISLYVAIGNEPP